MESHEAPTGSHDLQIQNLIDQLCDEFEESWQQGKSPDISDYLQRTSPNLRETLFLELVQIDIEYHSASGKHSSIEEYAERFPQFEGILARLQAGQVDSRSLELGELREIGSLKLLQKVGTGAFGVVWKAWDSQLEREVAVKLPTERSLGREYADEFRREAKAAAKLNHPGIVRVIDFSTHDGIAYIVYEFIDGMTLHQWKRKNTITPQVAAEFCAQIADALAHAHEHGVIHRDLKPGNIMINRAGKPLITDFGLAKRTDSASTIAGSGAVVGTLAYMSPEQAEGKSSETDARSDIYSLGAILYELLSGQQIFQGEPRQLIQRILFETPASLSSRVPGLHPDLATVCETCVRKLKSDRYKNSRELVEDLSRYQRGEAIRAKPLSVGIQLMRVLQERWGQISLVLITVPLLSLLIADVLFPNQGTTPSSQPAQGAELLNHKVESPWNVVISTNPAGAYVSVIPRDPLTGKLDTDRAVGSTEQTRTSFQLLPGTYQVNVLLPSVPQRSHEVVRVVPPSGASLPAGIGKPREFRLIDQTTIEWPVIEIPHADITEQMVYIEGATDFPVGDPEGKVTVQISPFYVSPHEFTYGDFLRIRPGQNGNVPGKPAPLQPSGNTMADQYDLAEHWAEESGGRLLTEYEFEYLAVMAAKAEKENVADFIDADLFDVAGGSFRDAIPTSPPIRGILSGFAEWTSSVPQDTEAWADVTNLPSSDLRIVRGGSPDIKPEMTHLDPRQRFVGTRFQFYPRVGFRIARSAHLKAETNE